MPFEEQIRGIFADGQSHGWGEVAALAERNLGRELILAAALRKMVGEGEIIALGANRYEAR